MPPPKEFTSEIIKIQEAFLRWRLAEDSTNETAFREFWILVERRIFTLAKRICNNEDDAIEVTQECAVSLFQSEDRKMSIQKAWGWLKKVAITRSINKIKKRYKIRFDDLDPEIADPGAALGRNRESVQQQLEILDAALGTLPRMQRMALELSLLSKMKELNLKFQIAQDDPELAAAAPTMDRIQIAEYLNINPSTFNGYVAEAKKSLADYFNRHEKGISMIELEALLLSRPLATPSAKDYLNLNQRRIPSAGTSFPIRRAAAFAIAILTITIIGIVAYAPKNLRPSLTIAEAESKSIESGELVTLPAPASARSTANTKLQNQLITKIQGKVELAGSIMGKYTSGGGATVSVQTGGRQPHLTAVADQDGFFTILLPTTNTHYTLIFGGGSKFTEEKLTLGSGTLPISGGTLTIPNVILRPAGTATGTVVTSSNKPAIGAFVELSSPSELRSYPSIVSTSGTYELSCIPPGEYNLFVTYGLLQLKSSKLIIKNGETKIVDPITLPQERILTFHFVTDGARPLSGAWVTPQPSRMYPFITKMDGSLELPASATDINNTILDIEHEDVAMSSRWNGPITASQNEYIITVAAAPIITFEILNGSNGLPVKGAEIWTLPLASGKKYLASDQNKMTIALRDITINKKSTPIVVVANGFAPRMEEVDASLPERTIRLYEGGSITGDVFDMNKHPLQYSIARMKMGPFVIDTVETDNDGKYFFKNVPESPVDIEVVANGLQSSALTNILASPPPTPTRVLDRVVLQPTFDVTVSLDQDEASTLQIYILEARHTEHGIEVGKQYYTVFIEPGGRRAIPALPAGDYLIQASMDSSDGMPGVGVTLGQFAIPISEPILIDTKKVGCVRGQVFDKDIRPQFLSILILFHGEPWFQSADVDPLGYFSIMGLMEGEHTMILVPRGFAQNAKSCKSFDNAPDKYSLLLSGAIITKKISVTNKSAVTINFNEIIPGGHLPDALQTWNFAHEITLLPRSITSDEYWGHWIFREKLTKETYNAVRFPRGQYRIVCGTQSTEVTIE